MNRRWFLQQVGASSVATALSHSTSKATNPSPAREETNPNPKTFLFWDLWHLERKENLQHCQGEPNFQHQGTYLDPHVFGLNAWPTVYRDQASGTWRMLYSALWNPFTLMVAESKDGIRWKPSPQPDIKPSGKKRAAHHLYTLEAGSGGGVYHDPIARDGFPFKVFCRQHGKPVHQRALVDKDHRWHALAKKEGVKRYMSEALTLRSRDGLRWSIDPQGNWALPDWHPEPPLFGFYNAGQRRHTMTVRPGWGDRRVAIQSSADSQRWSGPEPLLQPDPLDHDLVEFYGMPVFPYATGYVGLLWVFHCARAKPATSFNRFIGSLDCQLTYSYDGLRFHRGLRKPFISLNPPGEHGCAAIQPSCLVETDNEIHIYSCASKILHGSSRYIKNARKRSLYSILVHTLRKDGFMYLQSGGDWGRLQTKPLVIQQGGITLNVQASLGEVRVQVCDLESQPIKGFTFDECVPLKENDRLEWAPTWRKHRIEELQGKVLRLEVSLRNGRLYSLRGDCHFLDAQDMWMLRDGKKIDTSLFDY